jgi:cell division protease FtsH
LCRYTEVEGLSDKDIKNYEENMEEMTEEEHQVFIDQLNGRLVSLQAKNPRGLTNRAYKQKGPVGKMLEKVTGPRFVRNVNLRFLRDPFCAKGTNRFPTEVAYTGFYELAESGRVARVEYMSSMNSVKFFLKDTDEIFFANLPYDPTLYTMMIARNIDIVSKQASFPELAMRGVLNITTPFMLMYLCWILWMKIDDGDMSEGSTLQNTGTQKTYNSQPMTGMNMSDIAGIDVVREEMDELISYLRDYEMYARAGAMIPAGVLLCGPPGTGKTLLARCLAGEAQVPFFSVAGTEFMEMFVGVGAARIRNLFKQARSVKPCIIFIDEFDSVAVRRKDASAQDGNDEQVATINQLLTELDGFGGNSGVMVFAATNRPHVIDPALIRPGRFDRIIEMPLPNRRSRGDIIDLHSGYAQYNGMIDPDINVEYIARQAAGFTGADLENLVRTAALRNARNDSSTGRRVLADDDTFLACIDEIRRSNTFKNDGSGQVGEGNAKAEDELIQQMNPYVRDTITTYYAAQTLVAMMVPNYDEVAKVRVFTNGEETGQIVYVPDEVGGEGTAAVKRRAWYESKMAVLAAGQMAERYLYGGGCTVVHFISLT